MKQLFLLILINTIFLSTALAINTADLNYKSAWKTIENYEQKGRPKSALELIEKIYEKATVENNQEQKIKALIYKYKQIQRVEEDSEILILNELEEITAELEQPASQILHSLLGDLYWQYYNNNRYKILNRTETNSVNEKDIRTWDMRKLVQKSIYHFEKSLENSSILKETDISEYEELLIPLKTDGVEFRKTLYDVIAHKAIDFFADNEANLIKPFETFLIDKEEYFGKTDIFVNTELEEVDQFSFEYYVMKNLQELEKFHQNEDEEKILADVILKRLNYVYQNSILENRDELYRESLEKLIEKYSNSDFAANIKFRLAEFYREEAMENEGVEFYREYNKKAYEICKEIESEYPNAKIIPNVKNLATSITREELYLKVESGVIPNEPFIINVNYRNLDGIFLKLVDADETFFNDRFQSSREFIDKLNKQKSRYSSFYEVENEGLFSQSSTELIVDGLPAGEYVLMISNGERFDIDKEKISFAKVTSTNFSYITKSKVENIEFQLFNRKTGTPSTDVKAIIWKEVYNRESGKYDLEELDQLRVDNNGYLNLEDIELTGYNIKIQLVNSEESIFIDRRFRIGLPRDTKIREQIQTFYFTDRAIYRPGQTVHFKGITIGKDGKFREDIRVIKNENVLVQFFDVNNQKIAEQNLKSNEFGTFSGSFVIPQNLLTGNMSIRGANGQISFSVEEYKRPNFYIEFLKSEDSYKLGDKVIIQGEAKAYAGYNLANAEVKYKITRKSFEPIFPMWRWIPIRTEKTHIKSGIIKTAQDGKFEIEFEANPDLTKQNQAFRGFDFTVEVDITDITGETQTSTKTIKIANISHFLNIDFPENVDRDKNQIDLSFDVVNLEGIPANKQGKINIYKLKSPDKIYKNRNWEIPDKPIIPRSKFQNKIGDIAYNNEGEYQNWEQKKLVFEYNFNTEISNEVAIKNIEKYELGKYVIKMISESNGEEIKQEKYFTLYSTKAENPPYKMPFWYNPINTDVQPGDTAKILIGTSYENSVIMYQIENRGEVVKTDFINLSNQQRLIEIPVTKSNRGGFYLKFYFVKENRIYSKIQRIEVPWTDKKLDIKFEKFRDKLKPGEDEEWTIKISGADREVEAEMLAVLYDASLDALRENSWDFNIYPQINPQHNWQQDNWFSVNYGNFIGYSEKYLPNYEMKYPHLNWFGLNFGHYGRMVLGAGPMMKRSAMVQETTVMADMAVEDEAMPTANEIEEEKPKEVEIRTNFNETAFFYPHIRTNEDGIVEIKFTVPESLTKWKMMGIATTKDLEYGLITKYLETQKELMIRSNAPRFLREGDKIELTGEIINSGDEKLNGVAKLQLFDAITMKPIGDKFNIDTVEKSFDVNKGERDLVKWTLEVPKNIDALIYKITAETKDLSDGEQRLLPILKNRILVTETMPISIGANRKKEFTFDSFYNQNSDSLENYSYTFEFTSNPAWYIVQALPYLMENPYDNSESIFSRIFANSIAKNIVNNSPEIKRVFDMWRLKESDELLSKLEKNQELKSIIIENTPWLNEAKNETERKQRIGAFFENNRVNTELENAKQKLQENQLEDGSWPWFKGMRSNRYITQYIVTGFARLNSLGIIDLQKDELTYSMVKKAQEFLDEQLREDYDNLIKNKADLNKNNLSKLHINYLYARSYFTDKYTKNEAKFPIDKDAKKAFEYYSNQLLKHRHDYSNNRYMQGMIALILNKKGDHNEAIELMESIKEHALYSDEMGMYWKQNGGIYWHQSPIATQALLIEAFDEILDDQDSVDKMKLWLMKQKQTQNWKTTKATAEACYSFLLRGKNLLGESKLPGIRIGDKEIDLNEIDGVTIEDGTGYFKLNWAKDEIKQKMGKIRIENRNEVAAWGGVYWQYFEDLDKIEANNTNLQIDKKLFIEKTGDRGAFIEPIDNIDLKIGDRIIVRLEIRVDRDMEYVHIKDMRASAFEPENVISQYKWQDGLGYYEATNDSATNFFVDYLPRGVYIFEYPLRVTHNGEFLNGIATIEAMYAPEFKAHSGAKKIEITR